MMMVLVIMFVTAMVITFPTTLESSRNSMEGRLALAAAQSGVDYAWCRLQERPSWKGDGSPTSPGSETTINTPGLVVLEDHGDVWGFITDSSGIKSQFRIRFNWHDGTGGGDGLQDPSTLLRIPGQYVSFNNLDKSTPAPVLRGTPGSTAAVTTSSPSQYPVAQYNCCILVEGLAGKGLRDTGPSAPLPSPLAGRVVSQTLEVDLGRPSLANLDSALYGGDIRAIGSDQILDVQSAGTAPPRSRTLSRVTNTGGAKYKTPAGGSIVASDTTFNTIASDGPPPTITHEDVASQRKKWLQVKMTDIAQADPAVDAKLPAGTYVWRRNGTIDYFHQDFNGTIPTGTPTTLHNSGELSALMGAAGTPIEMDGSTYTLEFSKNVYVQPSGGITGLAIVPEPDIALLDEDRPKNFFNGVSGSSPVLTSTGDVTMKGSVIGKGSVTSTGDLTFQGASVFETDPGKNVALYATGNITMEAIPPTVSLNLSPSHGHHGHHRSLHHRGHHHYHHNGHHSTSQMNASITAITNRLGANLDGNDVMIAGLVYAGGNFTTNLGQGTMYLRGALVAYGGNADAGEEAGTNGGQVSLDSKGAQFVFDPNYVVSSMSLSAPSRLVRTLQNRY